MWRWNSCLKTDLTGLKGNFDFTLEWTPRRGGRGGAATAPDPTAADPDTLTIFDALQKQLGLKLDARKLPMDTLVIDKVERTPVEQ